MAYEVLNQGFYVNANLLFADGGTEDISNSIIDVMVRKRFLQDAFPLFVIDLQTTENIRNSIRDKECSIALRISYYNITNSESTDGGDEQAPEEGIIFDDIIRLYEKPFLATTSKTDVDTDDESTDTPEKESPYLYYRVSGIPESLVSRNRDVINRVYSNTKVINPVVNILSEFGKDMYIQQVNNNEKYRSILIPPLSPVAAIKYLDAVYDIYDNGAALFIDSKYVYLLSPLSIDINYKNAIGINIKTIDASAANDVGKIFFNPDTDDYKLSLNNVPSFIDSKRILEDSLGSHTVFYSYDDNFNLNKRSVNSDGFDKVRYFWNSNGKKTSEDNIFNGKTIGFSIPLANVNPEEFTPLTRVSVASDYANINGEYVINAISYILQTDGEKKFRCITDLNLIKK